MDHSKNMLTSFAYLKEMYTHRAINANVMRRMMIAIGQSIIAEICL
jgi:hypothetical protein